MRIRNNNVLDLEAAAGERLTLEVRRARGAVVTCVASGLPGGPIAEGERRLIPIASNPDSYLIVIVTCGFIGTSGGYCEIQLRDEHGTVAPYTVTQQFEIGDSSFAYTIDILP